MYYLNARYYDPSNGRFITKDTYRGEKKNPSTLHLYAYCINNPINYVDPSGHVPFVIPIGIGISKAFISKLLFTGGAMIVSGAAVVVGKHIKNKKYDHYIAELENYRVYFGKGISRSKAVSRLKKGKNVWSKSASKAKSIAKSASQVKKVESKSEIHFTAERGKRKLKYAYWHYHYLKNNKKDRGNAHSFYGDEKKNPKW